MPVRSGYQGSTDAPAQGHQVVVGHGRAAACERRCCRIQRRDPQRTVCREDVVAGCAGRDRPACADVVAQQFHPWCGQARPELGNADVDVFDVVEIGLLGPAVLRASSRAEPEDRPEESRADGRVADRDRGVIDAEEGASAVGVAPFCRAMSVREREQFQRVAIMITELERGHAAGAVRQPHRTGAADGPETPVRHDPLVRVRHVAHDQRQIVVPHVVPAGHIRRIRQAVRMPAGC